MQQRTPIQEPENTCRVAPSRNLAVSPLSLSSTVPLRVASRSVLELTVREYRHTIKDLQDRNDKQELMLQVPYPDSFLLVIKNNKNNSITNNNDKTKANNQPLEALNAHTNQLHSCVATDLH